MALEAATAGVLAAADAAAAPALPGSRQPPQAGGEGCVESPPFSIRLVSADPPVAGLGIGTAEDRATCGQLVVGGGEWVQWRIRRGIGGRGQPPPAAALPAVAAALDALRSGGPLMDLLNAHPRGRIGAWTPPFV